MNDLELTQRCAERMGLHRQGFSVRYNRKTRLEFSFFRESELGRFDVIPEDLRYDPLHDDAQCLALVRRFKLDILNLRGAWTARYNNDDDGEDWCMVEDANLNKAICMCVAQMPLPSDSVGRGDGAASRG